MLNDRCPCQRCNGEETGAYEDYLSEMESWPSEREVDKAWEDFYKVQREEDDRWMREVKIQAQRDLEDAIWTQIREESE